ncbi:MAG: hypothetical protein DRP95_01585 [Candidatus Latescibacterota bacterium]|nr:MAG: hypothetical protein DRP95_01585 [Candidatus Latescibacterota bacterium]
MPDVSVLLSTIYKLTEEIRRCTEERNYKALREKLDERGRRLEELRKVISHDITPDQRRAIGEGLKEVLRANQELHALLKSREEQLKEEQGRLRKGRQGIRAYMNMARQVRG